MAEPSSSSSAVGIVSTDTTTTAPVDSQRTHSSQRTIHVAASQSPSSTVVAVHTATVHISHRHVPPQPAHVSNSSPDATFAHREGCARGTVTGAGGFRSEGETRLLSTVNIKHRRQWTQCSYSHTCHQDSAEHDARLRGPLVAVRSRESFGSQCGCGLEEHVAYTTVKQPRPRVAQ